MSTKLSQAFAALSDAYYRSLIPDEAERLLVSGALHGMHVAVYEANHKLANMDNLPEMASLQVGTDGTLLGFMTRDGRRFVLASAEAAPKESP